MPDITKPEVIAKLIDNLPTILVLVGVIFLLLGIAGGVVYHGWLPIQDSVPRILSGLLGIAILITGVFLSAKSQGIPKASKYGVKITHPTEGEHVNRVTVRGTIMKAPPSGYTVRVLRVYSDLAFTPLKQARVSSEDGTWEANDCALGGNPGEQRWFAVFLVGPDGSALLDYSVEVGRIYNDLREKFQKTSGTDEKYLPALRKQTRDMLECHRVMVWRI